MGPFYQGLLLTLSSFLVLLTTGRARPFPDSGHHRPVFTDLNTRHQASRGTQILSHIIKSINVRPKREAQVRKTLDLDFVRQRLNQSLIAANDLKLRANETYELLCQLKIMYLPHEDTTLSTCARFAERSIQNPEFNIPSLSRFAFSSDEDMRQEVRAVIGEGLRIFGRYRFVVSNLTTMEENHLCNGGQGLQCGRARCSRANRNPNDPFSTLCHMKRLESRVRALFYSLKRTNDALELDIEDGVQTLTITTPPEISEYRRMMYGFGVTYQLHRQAQTFEYVLRFVNNLEEEALGLT